MVVGTATVFTNAINFNHMLLSAKVSSIAMNFFYFLLGFYLLYNYKQMKGAMQPVEENEADAIIEEFDSKEKLAPQEDATDEVKAIGFENETAEGVENE